MALHLAYRWAKRIAVTLLGGTVVLIGVAMLVLPGPALVVIPAGLAILGLEYAWARAWLARVKAKGSELARAAVNGLKSGNGG
ncbi:MAG: PGPGW domain-containing protein [Steroidobacteraceae bacterium]|nr:PGPGW domain-containing protein [Nevskiaceae bacterium]MCP5466922.1 PGPGW domain-containing protein [Nevskiaceae bacterium]MCP5471011.1 PGPGW domain-containing protein [Nevskiaceae bacterium]